jgi:hypothetical protein
MFTDKHLDIIRFCAIECELQVSGEYSVYNMVNAYEWALEVLETTYAITLEQIQHLGALVEPGKNQTGFRKCKVWVGDNEKLAWPLINGAISALCLTADEEECSAEEWFHSYEDIHPFVDGNGRSGVILYNWFRGDLRLPEWPPNLWNDPRRREGHGVGHL